MIVAQHVNRHGSTVTIKRGVWRSNADHATLERDCAFWTVIFHRQGSQIQTSQTRYSEAEARAAANLWFKRNDPK